MAGIRERYSDWLETKVTDIADWVETADDDAEVHVVEDSESEPAVAATAAREPQPQP